MSIINYTSKTILTYVYVFLVYLRTKNIKSVSNVNVPFLRHSVKELIYIKQYLKPLTKVKRQLKCLSFQARHVDMFFLVILIKIHFKNIWAVLAQINIHFVHLYNTTHPNLYNH